MKTKLNIDTKKVNYPTTELVKDMWALIIGCRSAFFFYTAILVISNLVPFLIAYLLGKIVDFFIIYQKGVPLTQFYVYIAIISVSGGIQVWLRFAGKWGIQNIGSQIRMKTRVMAMTKLVDLELKWHEKEETGSKIQKISSGGDNLYKAFNLFIDNIIPILTGLIGGILIFVFLNVKYVIFSIVFVAIYLFSEYLFNKRVSYWQDQLNKIREKVSGKIHEGTSNVLTVKTMGLKEVFRKSIQDYENQFFEVWQKTRRITQTKFKFVKIFSAVSYGLFLLMVGFDAVEGVITVGSIIIFINYFERIRSPMENMTNNLNDFIEAKSGVGRIMTIIDRKTIERESADLLEIPENWNKIEFVNVGFRYKNKWVLKNFSLTIKRNERIGIVGRSGCGKSTLVKLLLGMYKIQEGEILINGIDINKYKQSSIIKKIAVVLQDSEMFNASLKDNISITTEKAKLILLNEAIEFAQIKPLIEKLPNGLNTLVGEKGYKVSGGERQRIGIARAIYRNSDVLVLDEATSNLDSKTEERIQENIERFLKNKTLMIIAHRLSTLKRVDRIIVMAKGRMTESGTFEELIKRKGSFYELYQLQKSKEER